MSGEGKEISVAFGRALRRLRKARNLSQRQLARMAGTGSAFVSQIEHGIRQPSLTTIGKLAKALGCPLAQFFSTYATPKEKAPTE